MSIFQNPAEKTIAQYAAGLYGVAIGAPTNSQVLAQATTDGLYAVFDQYFELGFEPIKTSVVASLIVSNVGIVAGQYGLTAANVTAAVTYVQAQLDAAKATHTEGRAISELLANFSNMTGDVTFGAAATAWNTLVNKNLAYTSSGALKDVPSAQAVSLAPTYAVAVDKVSIAEGETVTYTITATGLAAGTEIAYSVTGVGNALASTKVGIATINAAGNAVVTVPTSDNFVINDAGSLSFKLLNGSTALATAANVTVTNNDNAATYAVEPSADSVAEGSSVTYNITTTGVAPGADLVYVVSGTNNALASTQTGLVTVNQSGQASVTINTFNNQVANDAGVLSFTLINGEVTLASSNVTVTNDDVVIAPNLSAVVTATEPFGTGGITEGDIVQFNIATTGYPVGTVMPYTITGTGNVSGIAKSGFVTIGLNGAAIVQLQTADNAQWDDAGALTFNLGDGLATLTTNVANDDAEVFKNTYTLTKAEDNFTDTNGDDDVFVATIGGLDPTLNEADDLDGGSGEDTLHIDVVGDDALFPVMADENAENDQYSFSNIEHVVLDLSDHNVDDDPDNVAIFGEDGGGSDEAVYFSLLTGEQEDADGVDASYFDADGSLKSLTILAEKDSLTSAYQDVYVHKDMTVRFQGSGVKNESIELDEEVILSHDVKNVTIDLQGVGGVDDEDYGGAAALWISQVQDYSELYQEDLNSLDELFLDVLNVTGSLSKTTNVLSSAINQINESTEVKFDAGLILGTGYGSYTASGYNFLALPNEINISLDNTNAKTIALDISPGLLPMVSTLDLSGSTANIETWLLAESFQMDKVDIFFGSGNDTLMMEINPGYSDGSEHDSNFEDDIEETQITIDMGDFDDDSNTIILTNSAMGSEDAFGFFSSSDNFNGEDGNVGNVNLNDSEPTRDSNDLEEDLIIVDNFDIAKDELILSLVMDYTNSSGSEDYFEIDIAADISSTTDDFVVMSKATVDGLIAGLGYHHPDDEFYLLVDAVADRLMSDEGSVAEDDYLTDTYAAQFVYKGDTYIYVDTNRTCEDYTDPTWDNRGLSDGDVLIKIVGVDMESVVFKDSVFSNEPNNT